MSTRRYRIWAGNPNGEPEDPERCIEEVPDGGRSVLFHQCRRKRGHGPDGAYCTQHAKLAYQRQEWWKDISEKAGKILCSLKS